VLAGELQPVTRLRGPGLERAGGCQQRAAAALGVLPTTLNEKMRRLDIGIAHHVVRLHQQRPAERERVVSAPEPSTPTEKETGS